MAPIGPRIHAPDCNGPVRQVHRAVVGTCAIDAIIAGYRSCLKRMGDSMLGNDQTIYTFRGPMGVRVEIQSTFLLLALLLVGLRVQSAEALMWGLVFFAIIAGSIFLHELGHAWGSLVQGVRVRRIVLHGAGGFCERSGAASNRQQELIVAMGPIVNLILWAVPSLIVEGMWAWSMSSGSYPGEWFLTVTWLLSTIARVNLFLALFNLIPVQPLDGGKLFRLGLMRLVDTRVATRVAGIVGLAICVVWIPAMIWMYMTVGWVLFFLPSFRLHVGMAKLKGFGDLKRRN